MRVQVPITKVEIHGDTDWTSPVVVDGQPLSVGLTLRRFGMDTQVTARLLHILVFLGLRRIGGIGDGWVTSDEIALFLEQTTNGAGVAKFLERLLEPYAAGNDRLLPDTHLIQYKPRAAVLGVGGTGTGGLSRGPYRLVWPHGGLAINVQSAWSYLLGPRNYMSAGQVSIEAGLVTAEERFRGGDIIGARHVAAATLRDVHLGRIERPNDGHHHMLLATLWDRIANLDMELGAPRLCLVATETSLTLYRRLRHPAGQAHALQLQAHAFGQLENSRSALAAAVDAMRLVDNAQNLRRGFGRAAYIGVLGQRLSKAGRYSQAERKLVHAQLVAEENDARHWASIWAVRRAENAIAAGDLGCAERHLAVAHEYGTDPRSTVPHEAARVRITASFFAAAGRVDEGRDWATQGHRIGVEKGMANQIRLMLPILRSLGMDPDFT